jgi:hypothetical protein
LQNMAQMLLTRDDPDILICAQLALDKANEAANNSCVQITDICKRLEFLPTDTEAESITVGWPPPKESQQQDKTQGRGGCQEDGLEQEEWRGATSRGCQAAPQGQEAASRQPGTLPTKNPNISDSFFQVRSRWEESLRPEWTMGVGGQQGLTALLRG